MPCNLASVLAILLLASAPGKLWTDAAGLRHASPYQLRSVSTFCFVLRQLSRGDDIVAETSSGGCAAKSACLNDLLRLCLLHVKQILFAALHISDEAS